MARTDLRKSKEAVWVPCPIPEFNDERHLLRPATRETDREILGRSMVKTYERNQLVEKMDQNLINENWIQYMWLDWEHVGLVHADGRVEDPAPCTQDNKLIIANSRPREFYLWLQQASEDLAKAVQQREAEQRETFREPDEVPAGLPEAGVSDV